MSDKSSKSLPHQSKSNNSEGSFEDTGLLTETRPRNPNPNGLFADKTGGSKSPDTPAKNLCPWW